ncbi:MAG: CTP synthase, partial [Caldilinea sp.]|nr:CTP synthase [Caldilinea sp.]
TPDVIVLRSDHPVEDDVIGKTALFCDVDREAVVPLVTADTIYAVPLSLEEHGLGAWTVQRLELTEHMSALEGLQGWSHFVNDLRREKPVLRVALVGKYVELEDSYLSVKESLIHAALACGWDVDIAWVSSEDLEKGRGIGQLDNVDGIIVPGGFGYRGIEGKVVAAHFAREHKVP